MRAAAKKSEARSQIALLPEAAGYRPRCAFARAEAEQEPKSESIAEDERFPQAAE